MQISFTGHQLEVTDALRQYAEEKLERLERHYDRITNIHVTLSVEKLSHIAEATINIPGNSLHATSESNGDMYAAIDALSDKLDRQLKKHKDKEHNGR